MKTEDKLLVYKTLLDVLRDDKSGDDNNTEDDKTFRKNTKEQISHRDEEYTKLLSHFVGVTKVRNILKEFFKWSFYLMIIISILTLTNITYSLFKQYISSAEIEQLLEATPVLITAMVSFVSTIIVIPVTITKYLFSTKEDENITKIILHTQEHDVLGRQWTTDFKKIMNGLEENNILNSNKTHLQNVSNTEINIGCEQESEQEEN